MKEGNIYLISFRSYLCLCLFCIGEMLRGKMHYITICNRFISLEIIKEEENTCLKSCLVCCKKSVKL